jgi:ComF family protein
MYCNRNLNDTNEQHLCKDCTKQIPCIHAACCPRCGATLGPYITATPQEGCSACRGKSFYFDTLTFITYYNGVIKTLIHKFKYAKHKFLHHTLVNIVTTDDKLSEVVPHIDIIVPIPLHWLKKMHRGFNQSELLSAGIHKYTGKPLYTNNLRRIKNTVSQTQLSKTQRKANIQNAFFVNNPRMFKGKNILLVDDVLTTGVTASECSKKLKNAGAASVHVFILAKAESNRLAV